MKFFILITVSLLMTQPLLAKLIETEVEYQIDNKPFVGFYVSDSMVKAKQPGALVIHNWMGITDETKSKAREIAKLGFKVLAADIYGKGQRPKNAKEAGGFAGKYKGDRALFRKHLNAGLEALKKQKGVDSNKLVAVGYCFGGTGAIELARSGADVKGVVSFHGGLDSPNAKDGAQIKGRVLALHGADDPYNSEKDLNAFQDEMRSHKVDWELIKYGNAVHSFTEKAAGSDNSKGAAYNKKADERSWAAMKTYFVELF